MADTTGLPRMPAPALGQANDLNWTGAKTTVDEAGKQVFHSYSGCDIQAVVFNAAAGKLEKLANIQTLSYSVHREKFPVRALGTTHVRQYVRGPRTIAGSLIFTVFDQSVLGNFLNMAFKETEVNNFRPITVDQIPPFHIVLLFASEYNVLSFMNIYNVEVVNEGQTMSVEDLITENVCQFVATHIAPLRQVTQQTSQGITLYASNFADLMTKPLYADLFRSRNPFDGIMESSAATLNNLRKATGQSLK